MGRPAICRICGTKLDTDNAYKVVLCNSKGKEKNFYYCSEEEYVADKTKKEKAIEDRNKAYKLICDIIGRKQIINTTLWKEWKEWNKVATDEAIWQYLEENKTYLIGIISKLDNVEFNRIRYLSAILKNKLGDFKPKEETKEPVVVNETHEEDVRNDIDLRINKKKKSVRRRGFAEMGD